METLHHLADSAVEVELWAVKRELDRLKAALRENEEQLRTERESLQKSVNLGKLALEAGCIGIWEFNATSRRATWSSEMSRLFAFAENEYDGTLEMWLSRLHPDDLPRIQAQITVPPSPWAVFELRYRIVLPNGQIRWIADRGCFQVDSDENYVGAVGICWDETERVLHERELRDSEELFRSLSESAPIGIFRADLAGNVTYVNPYAMDTFKASESELLGLGWLNCIHPDDRERVISIWRRNIELGKLSSQRFRVVVPDRGIRWAEGTSTLIRDQNGRPVGTVGTVVDITDLTAAIDELRVAKEAAEAANRAKDLFLANVSHELRTPLNGVLGMTELLLDSPLNEEQREYVRATQDCGNTLLAVVNDVLDLNRIQTGKIELIQKPFGLREIVRQAAGLVEGEAARKQLSLRFLFAPDLPERVLGDAERIKQILTNYLTNAVKFTMSGSITVEVAATACTAREADLLFSVTDTGCGIPAEAAAKLFQPFSQVDASSTRKHGGLGLGLAICSQLAGLMKGRTGMESKPGEGSRFWLSVTLPSVKA